MTIFRVCRPASVRLSPTAANHRPIIIVSLQRGLASRHERCRCCVVSQARSEVAARDGLAKPEKKFVTSHQE